MINKLIISLVQIAITFAIKIYLMKAVTLTGQGGVDKILFNCISIILIILTIKNFIDISISKRDKEKLSVWAQLAIFVVLMGVASIIWYLMNFYIFWVVVGAFVVSFVIVTLKNYKQTNLQVGIKRSVKKALKYNYGINAVKMKAVKKDDNHIFCFGEDREFCVLIFKLNQFIENDAVLDCLTKGAEIIKNEDNEIISQIKQYRLIVLQCESVSAVKIYNSILKQIALEQIG